MSTQHFFKQASYLKTLDMSIVFIVFIKNYVSFYTFTPRKNVIHYTKYGRKSVEKCPKDGLKSVKLFEKTL